MTTLEIRLNIMTKDKNTSTYVGTDKTTKKDVTLSKDNRLKNTLIIGPIGSGKFSLSLLPMIVQDIKCLNSATTIVSSNIDVLEKAFMEAKKNQKSVIYLDLTTPEIYEDRVMCLSVEDLIAPNKVLLVYTSARNPSFKETALYNLLAQKLLNHAKIHGQNDEGHVVHSLYLIDAPASIEYFEEITLGVNNGIAVTIAVQQLKELHSLSGLPFDNFHEIFKYHNLIIYPGISRHDNEIVKYRGIDPFELMSLPFTEVAYCVGDNVGFAQAKFYSPAVK